MSNFQPGVNPGSGTGLFLGLYDNGNTDALYAVHIQTPRPAS